MLKNYLNIAIRNLLRNKTYSFINIFGLAVSIAAVILILLYINFEFSYDNFHADKNDIYRVSIKGYVEGNVKGESAQFVPPIGPALKQDLPEVKEYTRFSTNRSEYFYVESTPVKIENITYADSTFFNFFSFDLVSGDASKSLAAPFSVVITNETAEKLFGKEEPLGKIVQIENEDYIVTAIVKSPPPNSSIQFDALISFSTLYKNPNNYMGWQGGNQYYTFVKLERNADLQSINSKLPDFMWKYINKDLAQINVRYEPYLQPIEDLHLKYSETGMTNIYIFVSVGFLILLIASINFINLTTANYTKRIREVGIRKVLGASRNTIMTQFLFETLLVTFISLILGLMLADLFTPYYQQLMQSKFFTFDLFNPIQIVSLLALLLLIGILAGSYPAFFLSSFKPIKSLRKNISGPGKKYSFQSVLITLQFVISISLITVTIIIVDQVDFVKNKDLGFDKENIIYLSILDEEAQQKTELIKDKLLGVAGVISASASSDIPSRGFTSNGYFPEGSDSPVMIKVLDVDEDFFSTYDLKLLEGRKFSKEFSTDDRSYVVNETLTKTFGWNDPLGKEIVRNGKHKVIGVVKDFNFASLREGISPLIITNKPWRNGFKYVSLKLKSKDYQDLIGRIEEAWKDLYPTLPFEYYFLDETVDSIYKYETNFLKLFTYFSSLAILIAALGLFSLSSLTAEQKTKEIGIRKVLGASIPNITLFMSKKYFIMVMIGNIISIPIAYYFIQRLLQYFAYRVDITIVPFLTASIIAIIAALLSVGYRSLKAAGVNPVESLRYE